MITVDTNVLVRLLVVDDTSQSESARALVEENRVFILRTVLLETEWVLRSRFGLERERIRRFFAGLADTNGIEIEADLATRRAIDAYAHGVDFADALHASASMGALHTFDKKLIRQRRRIAGAEIVPVPNIRKR